MRRVFILLFIAVQSAGFCYGQSSLRILKHKLLNKYRLANLNVHCYDKTDSLKGPVSLGSTADGQLSGHADFVFFLDSLGYLEEVKLVNIEVLGNYLTSNRMLDWRTFIKESKYDAYDLRKDVGITRAELAEIDMLPRTKKLAENLLKQLEDKIAFDIPPDIEIPDIVYCSFSF